MVDLEPLKLTPDLGAPPQRVVSLVPSLTESLFALGFGDSVVGITDYCIHPADQLSQTHRVGGTKKPDIEAIKKLSPELVFVNQEENGQEIVEALVEAGIPVWLTFPQNLEDATDVLRGLLAIYHTDRPAMVVNSLQMAVDWAVAAAVDAPKIRYFCPIWMDSIGDTPWWMTFNQNSYSHSLLEVVGGINIFADRERRYPLAGDLGLEDAEEQDGRDTRYPRVTQDEILTADPEIIILPSEPFAFDEKHKDLIDTYFAFTSAVKDKNVIFLDGSLLTWHGVRLGKALQDLPPLFFDL